MFLQRPRRVRKICNRCTAFSANGDRCKLLASCKQGCEEFCWIHAASHIVGQGCKDVVGELNQLANNAKQMDSRDLSLKLADIKKKLDTQNASSSQLEDLLQRLR